MARSSRKRGGRERATAVSLEQATAQPRPLSRSEERDAAVRAALQPLAPGERPWPLKIGALVALLVGGGDLIDVIAGGRITVGRSDAGVAGVVVFAVLMLLCAGGMWRVRYWAVLSFQAILAIVVLIFSLLLIRASSVLGLVVGLVVVGGGGVLFYKLVRTLSRIQVPRSPGP